MGHLQSSTRPNRPQSPPWLSAWLPRGKQLQMSTGGGFGYWSATTETGIIT